MELKGLYTALVTPFTKSNHIDYTSLEQLIKLQVSNGVKGIVIAGSTGEASSLNEIEYRKLIRFTKHKINEQVQLVVGTTNNNTEKVQQNIAIAREEGADAVMIAAPYYNTPSDKGIQRHFECIAENTNMPIILYNVPSRTACNISNDIIINLAKQYDHIIGIKEASGDINKITQLITKKPKNFKILSGDDSLTLSLIVLGAEGSVSVVSNLIPNEFNLLVNEAIKGNFHIARRLHFFYLDLIGLMFVDTNPSPVKAALNQISLCENTLRLPLVEVDKADFDRIGMELRSLDVGDSEFIKLSELTQEPILN